MPYPAPSPPVITMGSPVQSGCSYPGYSGYPCVSSPGTVAPVVTPKPATPKKLCKPICLKFCLTVCPQDCCSAKVTGVQVVKPSTSVTAVATPSTSSCPASCAQICATPCPQSCCLPTSKPASTAAPGSTKPASSAVTARPTVTPTSKKPKPVSCVAPACSPQTCLPSCPKPCCTKKRFHDMELVAGCPRVCFSSCEQVCPRRCCGPHPPIKATINQRPKINDIPQSPRCPKICADVCALECPHRCCGPGSMKRAFISRPFPRLAYMKNHYAFNQKRYQVPVSRFNNPRRFGLKKKRNTIH